MYSALVWVCSLFIFFARTVLLLKKNNDNIISNPSPCDDLAYILSWTHQPWPMAENYEIESYKPT